ncbi:putative nicotinate-nucleotide adenylyltransferase (fragment) [Capnocytophaga canimorsus]
MAGSLRHRIPNFKEKKSLLDNYHRLEMVHRAVEAYPKIRPSDIEFRLPQPNYTIKYTNVLGRKVP